jgi:hypothetical protein
VVVVVDLPPVVGHRVARVGHRVAHRVAVGHRVAHVGQLAGQLPCLLHSIACYHLGTPCNAAECRYSRQAAVSHHALLPTWFP